MFIIGLILTTQGTFFFLSEEKKTEQVIVYTICNFFQVRPDLSCTICSDQWSPPMLFTTISSFLILGSDILILRLWQHAYIWSVSSSSSLAFLQNLHHWDQMEPNRNLLVEMIRQGQELSLNLWRNTPRLPTYSPTYPWNTRCKWSWN